MAEQVVPRSNSRVDVRQVDARELCFYRHPTILPLRIPRRGGCTCLQPGPSPACQTSGPRVFSGYGIASAAVSVTRIGAIVFIGMIWSAHRDAAHDRDYQSRVVAAAAQWTGLLVNA